MTTSVEGQVNAFAGMDRASLRQTAVQTLKQAERTRADVLLLEKDGQRAVLKDYQDSNRGFALVLGPLLVYREVKALRKLGDLDGVPALLGRVTPRAFLMAYCPSTGLGAARPGVDWTDYIRRAESLVASLHARGVVHGDLRNYTNFMIDAAGAPVLVDFVSSVHRGAWWNPLGAVLFHLFRQLDEGGLYKLKRRYAPDLASDAEKQKFDHPGPLEGLARRCSHLVRDIVRTVFRIR